MFKKDCYCQNMNIMKYNIYFFDKENEEYYKGNFDQKQEEEKERKKHKKRIDRKNRKKHLMKKSHRISS